MGVNGRVGLLPQAESRQFVEVYNDKDVADQSDH